jgi:hypothetical protein
VGCTYDSFSTVEDIMNIFLFNIRGLSCPRSVKSSLTQNWLKLTKPGFRYNLLSVSCGEICIFKHRIGQVLAWKSGLLYCLEGPLALCELFC